MNIGDKVTIRKDLKVKKWYGNDDFTKEMQKFKGREAIVTHITTNGFYLDIDNQNWTWTKEMFEK